MADYCRVWTQGFGRTRPTKPPFRARDHGFVTTSELVRLLRKAVRRAELLEDDDSRADERDGDRETPRPPDAVPAVHCPCAVTIETAAGIFYFQAQADGGFVVFPSDSVMEPEEVVALVQPDPASPIEARTWFNVSHDRDAPWWVTGKVPTESGV